MFKLRKILKQNKKISRENLQSKFSLKVDRGFVSLIALLLGNIFLIIGLSVFNIALRELTLSSGSRESLFAFYAADGGMECALYWDLQGKVFATSSAPTKIDCNSQEIPVTFENLGYGGESFFEFLFIEGDINSQCVEVYVRKEDDGDTIIRSYGKNTCDTSNTRRVERAWQVSYRSI